MLKAYETNSRKQLIELFGNIAGLFNYASFSDNQLHVITIFGHLAGGKSLIAESLTKAALDQFKLDDLIKDGEKHKHFLEAIPSAANAKPHCITGSHGNQLISFMFDNGIAQTYKDSRSFMRSVFSAHAGQVKDRNIISQYEAPITKGKPHIGIYFITEDLSEIILPHVPKTFQHSLKIEITDRDNNRGLIQGLSTVPHEQRKWKKTITIDDMGRDDFLLPDGLECVAT